MRDSAVSVFHVQQRHLSGLGNKDFPSPLLLPEIISAGQEDGEFCMPRVMSRQLLWSGSGRGEGTRKTVAQSWFRPL